MLEISLLRSEMDRVRAGLRKRNYSDQQLERLSQIVSLDDQRKATQTRLDEALASSNRKSKQIGQLFQQGDRDAADKMRAEVNASKAEIKQMEQELRAVKEQLEYELLEVANVPHDSVPAGTGEADNEVYVAWDGPLPDLGPGAQAHWDLAAKYQLIDFKLGVKIAGAGFPLFRGKGARLQRALVNFFLREAAAAGYEEIAPPLLVNEDTARATGQLPDKEGQMYHVTKDDLYLIPTAEVPITNILRDHIVDAKDLPVMLTGYTPCFRREAGSYGSDVKGLNRVHQFDKVEIVQISHPKRSYEALEEMVHHVQGLLQKLELPFRILRLCGGDLGFTSALTFDFEVYSAGQKKWLEVSSVSNFETYQSNRLKLRYRDEGSKPQLAHTLNGSALALARIVAALLENNQDEGGIAIPKVLHPYTGFERIE